MKPIVTASQTIGPFFHRALDRPAWADLTRDGAKGTKIQLEGKVLDGDKAAVPDAFLEIWQANAAGKYDHPEDTQDKPVDPKFHGFGRALTDANGVYRFTTIKPGAVPGGGNRWQAPHLLMSIFARGLQKRLVTRIYFGDETQANDADPVLNLIDDPAVRRTLIAKREADGRYRLDIVLQGEGETAFFEL